MKNQTFTILLGWLLFLSSNLIAQKSEGRFRLKEGDWFEVQVEQNAGSTYLLNYQLKKQITNGNQQYNIRLDHFKIKKKYGRDYVGYDSYYPTFEENKTKPELKNQFSLEVTPTGGIGRFTPSKNNKSSKIELTSISPSNGSDVYTTYQDDMADSLMIHYISSILLLPASESNMILYPTESRVPMMVKLPDMQMFLTDASFPLTNNAIIKGRLKDQADQEITIRMIGDNSDYYFPEKQFLTQRDGSFNCPIFLKRPLHLRVQVGNQTLTTFMEPGSALNISAIGHQAREIQNNQYADTKPNEYYSPGWKKSDYFSDNAAYNTMLSNELDQYRNGFMFMSDVNTVMLKGKETAQAVNKLIDSYRGKASEACIRYFQSDFKYFLAVAKLYFKETQQRSYVNNLGKLISPKIIDFPADFFLEVDTMPVLMNPFEWNTSYQNFIQKTQQFKKSRLILAVGKMSTYSFVENYNFSQVSLQGFPLYNQIGKAFDLEYRQGFKNENILEAYYMDFLNNCADPALTEPLRKNYEIAKQLKPGNQFPVKSFVLQDSSIFNLEKYKGKPICLILINEPFSSIQSYKDAISKFGQDEVQFIIAKLPGKIWMEGKLDSSFLKIPNINCIELADKNIKSKLLLDRNRIFMLDKWFRIVENNSDQPPLKIFEGKILNNFEESLRKTIETKRYSKAEKTAMIKTAGWSFGSILFTFLIGLWIYRIRVRRIKTQEAAKRRIQELEIKAIRSQMNPHFIFNALNSIQSLINGSQFKEANIYLSKFAILLRGVLNNSEKNRISLSDELQAIELYCQLEQLRFEFKFEISIDPEVNADLIEIPGMIIQPLAENAVVHGLSGKGDQGKLTIQVKRQNENLCVCVSDNGIGLQSQKIDELSQKGFGLKLVEERINILNLDGKEAKLTVENRSNATGTVATLIIPID
jgi:two-component sensor histidine kinase